MKILLLGKDGQVGWELQRALAQFLPLSQLVALGRKQCDLNDVDQLRSVVQEFEPGVIVNAAAYTAVDKAEEEPDVARTVNALAPAMLAEVAKKSDALLIHYSTDYVFDGRKIGAYIEADAARPLSVYGTTKLEGEMAIQASGCRHLIFRTSWVFSSRGNNFATRILQLARECDALRIVDDQLGAPTSAALIADVTAHCLRQLSQTDNQANSEEQLGLYHLTASGSTNWFEYARYIVATAQKSGDISLKCYPDKIEAIATSNYPTAAQRPLNSLLETKKLTAAFGLYLPVWTTHFDAALNQILSSEMKMRL